MAILTMAILTMAGGRHARLLPAAAPAAARRHSDLPGPRVHGDAALYGRQERADERRSAPLPALGAGQEAAQAAHGALHHGGRARVQPAAPRRRGDARPPVRLQLRTKATRPRRARWLIYSVWVPQRPSLHPRGWFISTG
eukprot:scaffold114704_cov69-Phaeocystis_antarctica.AAC.2